MGGASKLLMLLSTPLPLLSPRPITFRVARHSRLALTSLHTLSSYATPRRLSPSSGPRPRYSVHAQAVREESTPPIAAGGGFNYGQPWPEWVRFVEHARAGGFGERRGVVLGVDGGDDEFSGFEWLPEEFLRDAVACLAFSRERPELLRLLTKKDVEVVAQNGSPFLFKNAMNSSRRMRSFLDRVETSVENNEGAETVDVMRYLLGYVYNYLISSREKYSNAMEPVEASVRNLFNEMIDISETVQGSNFTEPLAPHNFERSPRQPRQNIEMKRGDWICPKCHFMNFARNMKCLECDEERPKRQLTGGEWECPQCDFFNYGRNMACLKCDCKRPEGTPSGVTISGTSLDYGRSASLEDVYNATDGNKSEIERRLTKNDEKADRWFQKVSQLGDTSDLSSAIADEDFPEIMPLRKGVNRFVVSTRKTPLERRLANDQYRRNMVGAGPVEKNESGTSTESSISRTLDRILGQSLATQGKESNNHHNTGSHSPERRDPGSVPFVPLAADMFRKPQTEGQQSSENVNWTPSKVDQWKDTVSENGGSHDVKDLTSTLLDEDVPDIMPMRKGENRFVISKKKDRSLTSPQYKRRLAMEQTNNSNFAPFVPFPPGYFARKDGPPEAGSPTMKAGSSGITSENIHPNPARSAETKAGHLKSDSHDAFPNNETKQKFESFEPFGKDWNTSKVNPDFERVTNTPVADSGSENHAGNLNPASWNRNNHSWTCDSSHGNNSSQSWISDSSYGSNFSDGAGSSPSAWNNNSWRNEVPEGGNPGGRYATENSMNPGSDRQNDGSFSTSNSHGVNYGRKPTQPQAVSSQNTKLAWSGGFSGKSLEGSAVTEPDPLDMSEEAKAQRWFRRVAQITDISELSNIPDEDFPEIMPMRKGVNRFVVSKRKTPLERRLTSPQYRRNLPSVSSEPEKDSKQGNT